MPQTSRETVEADEVAAFERVQQRTVEEQRKENVRCPWCRVRDSDCGDKTRLSAIHSSVRARWRVKQISLHGTDEAENEGKSLAIRDDITVVVQAQAKRVRQETVEVPLPQILKETVEAGRSPTSERVHQRTDEHTLQMGLSLRQRPSRW